MKEYKTYISLNLPISLVEKIEDFKTRYKKSSRGHAIEELLKLAMYVESKLGLVDTIDNQELETIKEQIQTGQLVDYVAQMDLRKFNLIISIMKDEERSRLRQTKIA